MVEPPRSSSRSSASSDGLAHFGQVDAVMAAEAAVLGHDHRKRELRRDARERHVDALDPRAGQPAPQHHGRDRLAEGVERREQIRQRDQQRSSDERDGAQHPRRQATFFAPLFAGPIASRRP